MASAVKDILGFSEPKEGPLSNFHTYAPDMMDLFAQGIKQNEDVVKRQVEQSFDFKPYQEVMYQSTASNTYTPADTSQNDNVLAELSEYLPMILQAINDSKVELAPDAHGIFNIVRNENNAYRKANGVGALA